MDLFFIIPIHSLLSSLSSFPQPHKSPMADRFIPIRNRAVWKINFDTNTTSTPDNTNTPAKTDPHSNSSITTNDENIGNSTTNLYKKVLKSELLDPEDESPLKMSKNIFQVGLFLAMLIH